MRRPPGVVAAAGRRSPMLAPMRLIAGRSARCGVGAVVSVIGAARGRRRGDARVASPIASATRSASATYHHLAGAAAWRSRSLHVVAGAEERAARIVAALNAHTPPRSRRCTPHRSGNRVGVARQRAEPARPVRARREAALVALGRDVAARTELARDTSESWHAPSASATTRESRIRIAANATSRTASRARQLYQRARRRRRVAPAACASAETSASPARGDAFAASTSGCSAESRSKPPRNGPASRPTRARARAARRPRRSAPRTAASRCTRAARDPRSSSAASRPPPSSQSASASHARVVDDRGLGGRLGHAHDVRRDRAVIGRRDHDVALAVALEHEHAHEPAQHARCVGLARPRGSARSCRARCARRRSHRSIVASTPSSVCRRMRPSGIASTSASALELDLRARGPERHGIAIQRSAAHDRDLSSRLRGRGDDFQDVRPCTSRPAASRLLWPACALAGCGLGLAGALLRRRLGSGSARPWPPAAGGSRAGAACGRAWA